MSNYLDFWGNDGVVSNKGKVYPRFGVQPPEYSNVRRRMRGVSQEVRKGLKRELKAMGRAKREISVKMKEAAGAAFSQNPDSLLCEGQLEPADAW